jgi:hypothetical protein
MRDWLKAEGCTSVVMESTGVYWKPIFNVLETRDFELLVANARHVKAVPGRKTDVKDAEWLADLVRHGLIRPSFVPPPPIRELRDLMRYRWKLVAVAAGERDGQTARAQARHGRPQRAPEAAGHDEAIARIDPTPQAGRPACRVHAVGERDPIAVVPTHGAEVALLPRGGVVGLVVHDVPHHLGDGSGAPAPGALRGECAGPVEVHPAGPGRGRVDIRTAGGTCPDGACRVRRTGARVPCKEERSQSQAGEPSAANDSHGPMVAQIGDRRPRGFVPRPRAGGPVSRPRSA